MKKLLCVGILLLSSNWAFSIHARYFLEIQSQKSSDMGYNYLDLSGSKEVSKEGLDNQYCYMFIYEDKDDSLIKIHYIRNGRISYIPLKQYSTINLAYEDGFELRTFADPFGNAVANEWGIYTIRTKLDEDKRYLKSFNYDKKTRLTDDNNGVCMYGFDYDEQDRLIQVRSFDKRNKPVLDKGYAMISLEYQDEENTVTKTYLDARKKPAANIFGVVYEKVTSVSTNAYSVKQFSYFGGDFKPVLHKALQAHSMIQIIDDRNASLETRYYDTQDKLITGGVAVIRYKLDQYRHIKSIAYFDHEYKATAKQGVHRLEYKNDRFGNVLELAYYNTENDLVPQESDVALLKYQYNRYGDMISKQYFGIDERPAVNTEGIHKYTYMYNDRGQDLEIASYDLDGALKEDSQGYAKYHKEYDVYGRLVSFRRFGQFDQLKPDKDGVAYTTIEYKNNGKIQYYQFNLAGQVIETYSE